MQSAAFQLATGRSTSYQVHPVVIFSILDQFKRRQAGQKRVMGTLLGEIDGSTVYVNNCFRVPHSEAANEQVSLDVDYHTTMVSLHTSVNPKEVVIGWYITGDALDDVCSDMNQMYRDLIDEPLFLSVDTELQGFRMAVKGYVAKPLTVKDRVVMSKFNPVNLTFYAHEAERIGVDALINSHPDDKRLDAPASILSDFENLEVSMGQLLGMIETVRGYVDAVVEGKKAGDKEIGRAIAHAIASVPSIDVAAYEKMFNSNIQDLLMVVYLSNLTRTQLALADKINLLLE